MFQSAPHDYTRWNWAVSRTGTILELRNRTFNLSPSLSLCAPETKSTPLFETTDFSRRTWTRKKADRAQTEREK